MSGPMRVQATCVALQIGDALLGVLLRGASGAGKSDLALRLIDSGAALVADDLVELREQDGALIASAPETIRGRMEVRGVGILDVPWVECAPLALIVELVTPKEVPRLPDPAFEEFGAIALPKLALASFESSTPAKIRVSLQSLKGS